VCTLKLRHLKLKLLRITRSFIKDRDKMDWELTFAIYWPHDRFAVGWDILHADETYNYNTYILYLGILTITLDVNN
jgi:hypothetical protein